MCFLMFVLLLTSACSKDDDMTSNTPVEAGNDPNFTIVAHSDDNFSDFNRKVVVFGIDIYAVAQVEDSKLLHAANIMAQYLDNDEDGNPDNQAVVDRMQSVRNYAVSHKPRFEKNGKLDRGSGFY